MGSYTIVFNPVLTDWTEDSLTPSIDGLEGGLKIFSIFRRLLKLSSLVWSNCLIQGLRLLCAIFKSGAFLEMKLPRADKNESVNKSPFNLIWVPRVVRNENITTELLVRPLIELFFLFFLLTMCCSK